MCTVVGPPQSKVSSNESLLLHMILIRRITRSIQAGQNIVPKGAMGYFHVKFIRRRQKQVFVKIPHAVDAAFLDRYGDGTAPPDLPLRADQWVC